MATGLGGLQQPSAAVAGGRARRAALGKQLRPVWGKVNAEHGRARGPGTLQRPLGAGEGGGACGRPSLGRGRRSSGSGCQVGKEKARGPGEKSGIFCPGGGSRDALRFPRTRRGPEPGGPRVGCSSSPPAGIQVSPGKCSVGQAEPNFSEGSLTPPSLRTPKPASDPSPVPREAEFDVDVVLHPGRPLLVKLRKHEGVLDFDCFCSWVTPCRVQEPKARPFPL